MKSIFVRVLSLLLVAIVAVSALASCNSPDNGGGGETPTPTTEAPTPEATKRPIVTKDPAVTGDVPGDPDDPDDPDDPEKPVVGKYLEDFETSSISETGKLVTTTSEVIGMIGPGTSDGSGTPEIVSDPAGGTNKVLKFTSSNGGKYFFMLPNNKATKTAVSFDLYNEDFDASTQTTMGVKYNADVDAAESSFFAALQNVYCRFYDNGLNDADVIAQTNAGRNALSNGVWYTAVMERDGNTVRAIIYERDDPSTVKYDKTFTFSANLCSETSNDFSRVAIDRGGGAAKGIVYIDNICYVDLEKYPDDNPNQSQGAAAQGKYLEDFEAGSLAENGNWKSTSSKVSGMVAPGTPDGSGTPEIVDDPAGGTNKVMKFTSSNGGKYFFTLPNNKATKTVVSFDFYFEDFDASTQTTMGVKYIADSVSAESSFFAAIQNVYCRFYDAGINDADVIAQTNAGKAAVSNGVWYTAVMERDGSTIRAVIYEKENPENVKYDKTFTFTKDLTASNNEYSRIAIERGGGSAKGIVYIDNISYTDLEKYPPAAAE